MLMSRALNTIIHQIRHEKLVSSMRKEQYETHTAIPNTLLHDNSRCVTTIIELLMVLTF